MERTYRYFYDAEDEHGAKASKVWIREEATKKREEKHRSYEVSHQVCGFGQREMHLIENVCDQVVPNSRNRHHLKGL